MRGAYPPGPDLEVRGPALQRGEGADGGGYNSGADSGLSPIDREVEERHRDRDREADQLVPATAHPPEAQRHGQEAYGLAGGGGQAPLVDVARMA